MGFFDRGDAERIAALEREVAALKAERARILADSRALAEKLRTSTSALEAALGRLARRRRSRRPQPEARASTQQRAVAVCGDDAEVPVLERASYTFEAERWQLDALDLMLRLIHEACDCGSWITFDVSVDGDGSARMRVMDGAGQPLALDPELWHWAFGDEDEDDERPATSPRDVHRERGVLVVELA